MDAAAEDSGETQGNTNRKRRRSKEPPALRRAKDRRRKRKIRAEAAGRRPPADTSSSEDELPKEIGGFPQENNAFPINERARQRVADLQSVAGPSRRATVVESLVGRGEGNTSGNPTTDSDGIAERVAYESGGEVADGGGEEADGGVGSGQRETSGEEWGNRTVAPAPENEEVNGAQGAGGFHGEEAGHQQGQRQGNPEENQDPPQPLWEDLSPDEKFALAVQKVKGSSNVSDAAVNKLLEVVVENLETVRELQGDRGTSMLYSRRLKPLAAQFTPKVKSGVLLEVKHPHGIEYRHEQELDSIPKEYLAGEGNLRVIREEAYVSLQDIKRHHEGIHAMRGITRETLKEHYQNCAMSVDGVQESHKGKKKFHVVSLRLGSCIYLYKIFNPLIGHPAADPSLGELLG